MRHERGFSLVELMVAMTVTLIVSGAIYGLLTSGGNAFRREPELADRQQNIRTAMDLVSRDVFNAGAALPTFAQAFTRTDPAGGACVGRAQRLRRRRARWARQRRRRAARETSRRRTSSRSSPPTSGARR